MRDLENLQSRLAREEATLTATQQQIDAAHRQIEALNEQIDETQRQIEATGLQIQQLQERMQTVERRIALLREYMTMVEAGEESVEPLPGLEAEPSNVVEPSLVEESEAGELDDLELGPPVPSASDGVEAAFVEAPSFENIDEDKLSHEILPRAQTFEEELLLLMAYHRKAIKPKDINRAFRRLDYTPKFTASQKAINSQVGQEYFELVAGGRIALTREGREEAQRLLEQLLQ